MNKAGQAREVVEVKLRYLEVSPKGLADELADSAFHPAETRDAKAQILKERLGIEVKPGETPLEAWLRAMAEENGLPVQTPAHPAIREAILFNPEAIRFIWWLA